MTVFQTTPSNLVALQTNVEISTIADPAFVVGFVFRNVQSTNVAPSGCLVIRCQACHQGCLVLT
jgi:hypothetical protein